ncbi:MAG: transcription termination factor NusA, partial [Pirellula sp.]
PEIAEGVIKINATVDGRSLSQDEIGRIGAQTAKQVIIQKLKEAERDARLDEFHEQVGQLVTGIVQRTEKGLTIVQLGNVEAILPKSEQIPGEAYHNGSRVRAVIYEVKASGNRVKIILSRTKGTLVQRLFEQEVPEIAEGVIKINAISREPGYRSKVAVSSSDQRIDCVGACVGMRGNRIKNVTSELAGERIDIVRWSDDPMVLIPNALQPAQVEQVLLCDMIGRAIALVNDEHLSQAIGRFGQNVRLASKLCGWDIEIMTAPELERQIERAMEAFMQIDGMTEEVAQQLVEQGYLSFDDLSVIEPEALIEMGGYTEDQVNSIVEQAEDRAAEQEAEEEARKQQEKAEKERRAAEELDKLENPGAPPQEPPAEAQ